MVWLWFLAGAIFGLALGMMVTCAIVINRELDDLEDRWRKNNTWDKDTK